jgi:hypothetical protein
VIFPSDLFHATILLDGEYLFGLIYYSFRYCAFTAAAIKAQYQLRAMDAEDLENTMNLWSILNTQTADVQKDIGILKTVLQIGDAAITSFG